MQLCFGVLMLQAGLLAGRNTKGETTYGRNNLWEAERERERERQSI
jgi:hypothetical protein